MGEEHTVTTKPKRVMADISRPVASPPHKTTSRQRSRIFKRYTIKKIGIGLVAILLIGVVGFFIVRYNSQQNEINRLSNPQNAAQKEQAELVAKVSKIVDLPQNENPTVATVSDANKLKDQSFFAKSQNGDKVLIYSQSKLAVLFRPSINKVIQVSQVSLGSVGS